MSPNRYALLPLIALCLLPACKRGGSAPVDSTPVKISAYELVTLARTDGKQAEAKYGKRIVEVTSVVNQIGSPGTPVRLVAAETPKNGGLRTRYELHEQLVCNFPKDAAMQVAALLPGQTVTLRGTFISGVKPGVTQSPPRVDDCELVSKGDVTVKSYTIKELREALGDHEERRLNGLTDPIIVTGTLKSARKWEVNPIYTLTAEDDSDKPPLTLSITLQAGGFAPAFVEHLAGLKAGSAFRAYGKLQWINKNLTLVASPGQATIILPQ